MKNIIFTISLTVLFAVIAGCSSDDEIAEVNGKGITKREFDAYLKYKRIPGDQATQVAAELDRYLEREGIADVIEDQDLLDKTKINVELNEFRKQMVISRYMEEFLRKNVTQDAVKNFYAANMDRYESKKTHVAHILFRTNSKTSESEKQGILTLAQEAYSKINAGEDFAKIAEKYSEDIATAKKGGDLGWLAEGAIDPIFSATVEKMKAGEVSLPFATPFGFHIVKVLEEPQVVRQPFEKASGNIRYELRQKAKEAEYERLHSLVKIEKATD